MTESDVFASIYPYKNALSLQFTDDIYRFTCGYVI